MTPISELNSLSREGFVRIVGPVFEHSSWIAGVAWADRPFNGLRELHEALKQAVQNSSDEKQLALLRAHPDLVGRAAQTGSLTPASASEQASAGLDRLARDEIETFQKLNQAYLARFGFPFIICARLNRKEAILSGFRARLEHSREQEIETALEEVFKIAYLRLQDILS